MPRADYGACSGSTNLDQFPFRASIEQSQEILGTPSMDSSSYYSAFRHVLDSLLFVLIEPFKLLSPGLLVAAVSLSSAANYLVVSATSIQTLMPRLAMS